MDKDNDADDVSVRIGKSMCVCMHCKHEAIGNNIIIFDFVQQEIKWSCEKCGEQNVFRGWSEFRSKPFPKIRTQR
jgi:hypothetical protein